MNFNLIGLSVRDKRVYEALIESPQSSIRRISEATGINRGSVFESIKDLLAVGLVTQTIVGKRTAYRAKDPEVLQELIDEKRSELKFAKAEAEAYAKKLTQSSYSHDDFHFSSSYEGDEGLASILRDVLKTCRKHGIRGYFAISSPKVSSYLYNNFPHFTRERVKQKLEVKVLRQGSTMGEQAEYAESRSIQSSSQDTSCYTIIYGPKVAIITINEYNQTSGVIIDNLAFAEAQRALFIATWNKA